MLVCDLQGFIKDKYILTDPAICSDKANKFGNL